MTPCANGCEVMPPIRHRFTVLKDGKAVFLGFDPWDKNHLEALRFWKPWELNPLESAQGLKDPAEGDTDSMAKIEFPSDQGDEYSGVPDDYPITDESDITTVTLDPDDEID